MEKGTVPETAVEARERVEFCKREREKSIRRRAKALERYRQAKDEVEDWNDSIMFWSEVARDLESLEILERGE